MKVKKVLLLTALGAILMPGLTSCGSGVGVGGAKKVQVRCFKGGYGDEWLKEMATNFMETYKDEGYEIDIVESSSGVTERSKQEIKDPGNNEIDLYFTNGCDIIDYVDSSKSILKTSETVILEDLTDVFESHAIDGNGKEEKQTIKERFFDGYEEAFSYNGHITKWQNKMFALPWADGMTGIFLNRTVLNKYGIDTPLTSDELAAAMEKVYVSGKEDGVYPYAFAQNTAGYWSYLYETWFAQYSGCEAYKDFSKCEDVTNDRNIKDTGYKVYEDKGILRALEAMYKILDINYAANGSASMDHINAQTNFVTGKAAFMCNGDWLMHEMKTDYFDEAKDIEFLPAPILSSLGSENGLSDAELHKVVQAIDDKKTDVEIKAIVPSASDAALAKIRDARSIHDGIGIGHAIYIPSYADAKEVAKLFLRYLYSNDGCRIFRNKAYGNLPLSYVKEEGDMNSNFQKSCDKMYQCEKPQMVGDGWELNEVRSVSLMYNFNKQEWIHPNTFISIMVDKDTDNLFTAQSIYEEEAQYMCDNWATYMQFVD